jgi:hypothetical protein
MGDGLRRWEKKASEAGVVLEAGESGSEVSDMRSITSIDRSWNVIS